MMHSSIVGSNINHYRHFTVAEDELLAFAVKVYEGRFVKVRIVELIGVSHRNTELKAYKAWLSTSLLLSF